jgi:phage gpG-like protein
MSLKIVGLSQMIKGASGANGNLNRSLKEKMEELVLRVEGRAKFYIRGSRSTNPDDILGVVTDRLRGSLTSGVDSKKQNDLIGEIRTNRVPYAATHEFGDGSRGIRARPYLARAIRDLKDEIFEELGDQFSASTVLE